MTAPKITRRGALLTGAWSAPVIAAAIALPAHAASAGFFVVTAAYWDVAANQGMVKLTAVDHFVELKDLAYGYYASTAVDVSFDSSVPLPGYQLTFLLAVPAGKAPPTASFTVDFAWIRWFPPLTVPVPLI